MKILTSALTVIVMLSFAEASKANSMSKEQVKQYDRASDIRTGSARADGSSDAEPAELQEEQDSSIHSGQTEKRYGAHENGDASVDSKSKKKSKKK